MKSSTGEVRVQKSCKAFHKFLSENLKPSPGDNVSTKPNLLDSTTCVSCQRSGRVGDPARGSGSLGFALVPRAAIHSAVYVVPSANLLNSLRRGKQMSAFAPLVPVFFGYPAATLRHTNSNRPAGSSGQFVIPVLPNQKLLEYLIVG